MSELKLYKFASIYEMSSGISSKPEQAGHGSPFVSFKTVFNNYFLPKELTDLMHTSETEQKVYSVKEGDIFLTRTSETLDELGMSSVALKNYSKATFSGFLKRLRPIQSGIVYHKYMAFYLRSLLFRKTMSNNAIMTLRASFNEQIFSYLNLLLPSYEKQKKVGDLLFLIYDKIELNNRINAELEAMAKTLYDYWFVQFDFPDANGKPYKSLGGKMVYNDELKREIPEGWKVIELNDIISRCATGLNPRKNFKLGNGNNYYVTIKNIKNGKIILDNKCDRIDDAALAVIDKRSDLKKGDILFTSIEPVGTTYLIKEQPLNWNINESVFTIRPNYNKITSEYLYLLLSSSEMKCFTKNRAYGSIHKGIRHNTLKSFKLALPDNSLIKDITIKLNPILSYIYILEKENLHLTSLRDWLLPMLMNGQVGFKETYQEQTQTVNLAAEAEVEYKPTVKNDNFYKIQNVYAVLYANKLINVQQGEMALAKDMYLVDRIAQVNTGFAYAQHNWGSFDPTFKKTINNTQYFAKCNFPNSKAYYCDTADNGYLLAKIPNELKEKANATIAELHNKIFKDYFGTKKAEMKELYATVLKCIEDTKSTDFAIIRQAMKNWKTPKQNFPDKASKFSEQQTKEALIVIIKEGWGKKVLNRMEG